MRRTSTLTAAATAALLLTGPALAQDFGEWDEDDDAVLGEEEFTAGLGETGLFDEWDADASGVIEEEEFNAGVYDTWDADESGAIEEEEWAENEAEIPEVAETQPGVLPGEAEEAEGAPAGSPAAGGTPTGAPDESGGAAD